MKQYRGGCFYVLIACSGDFRLYFSLQTRWGADHVSNWVSENKALSPHIRRDGSSFFRPSHLLLRMRSYRMVSFRYPVARKNRRYRPEIRRANRAAAHVDTIPLQDGTPGIFQCKPSPFPSLRLTALQLQQYGAQ